MFFTFLYCAVFSTVSAILAPGYEDELYCEDDHCMREKDSELLGSITLNHECVHREHATVKDVKTWGSNEGPEKRVKLLGEGYHSRKCNEEQVEEAELQSSNQSESSTMTIMFHAILEFFGF